MTAAVTVTVLAPPSSATLSGLAVSVTPVGAPSSSLTVTSAEPVTEP